MLYIKSRHTYTRGRACPVACNTIAGIKLIYICGIPNAYLLLPTLIMIIIGFVFPFLFFHHLAAIDSKRTLHICSETHR